MKNFNSSKISELSQDFFNNKNPNKEEEKNPNKEEKKH